MRLSIADSALAAAVVTSSQRSSRFGSAEKRATLEQIAYKGNVGAVNSYGSNMIIVKDAEAGSYDYTVKFVNAGSSLQKCKCWNKIGPEGDINGSFSANKAVLPFDIPVKGKQRLAFEPNTQGGCTCHENAVPLTPFGQLASTWVEFDFENSSNGGYSGADASCLVAAEYGLSIPGLKVCDGEACSIINAGGTGSNAYLAGMAHEDGVGLNLIPGPVHLTATVDYKG